MRRVEYRSRCLWNWKETSVLVSRLIVKWFWNVYEFWCILFWIHILHWTNLSSIAEISATVLGEIVWRGWNNVAATLNNFYFILDHWVILGLCRLKLFEQLVWRSIIELCVKGSLTCLNNIDLTNFIPRFGCRVNLIQITSICYDLLDLSDLSFSFNYTMHELFANFRAESSLWPCFDLLVQTPCDIDHLWKLYIH